MLIPNAVYVELLSSGAPQTVADWTSSLPEWVEVRTVSDPDPTLQLGAGETEAITLAVSLKADALLMDERKGRREALARGLIVSGTLNVLDAAAERGLVDLSQAIDRRRQTSFRVAPKLLEEDAEARRLEERLQDLNSVRRRHWRNVTNQFEFNQCCKLFNWQSADDHLRRLRIEHDFKAELFELS